MDLLLLRHADALNHAATDLARPLSERGHRQAAAVANALADSDAKPKLILSSPAVRTMETAAAVAKALQLEVTPCPWAAPGMSPADARAELKKYASFGRVLLVGHQPDLSVLAAGLLGMDDDLRLNVTKASLMHLHLDSPHSAELISFVPCNIA